MIIFAVFLFLSILGDSFETPCTVNEPILVVDDRQEFFRATDFTKAKI